MFLDSMKKSLFVQKAEEFSKSLEIDLVKQLYAFDTIESTNTTAKDLAAKGASEGTVVIARTQTHGRGRFDRVWESPEGGVYLSIILRPEIPPENTSLLPFVAALAVTRTIRFYEIQATIKWPNDVQVNGKKIAGILLESEVKGATVNYVIIGIGLNLNVDPNQLSSDIQPRSTSVISEVYHHTDLFEFLKRFFQQFNTVYTLFKKKEYDYLVDQWKLYNDTLGKNIQIQTGTEVIQGTAVDVDHSGFLLVRTAAGEQKKVMSGDCSYLDESDHA
jgi:BirA family biotin operon repressor/biotin-[acetyl-CoA-carboxylase] ligase